MKTKNIQKRILGLLLSILVLGQIVNAQSIQLKATYYGDKFVNKGDIVELVLINGRGALQWQKSLDQINWENIDGATNISITPRIDTTLWFRVMMEEENCDSAYSEVGSVVPMMISEEAVVLDSESMEILSDSTELSQGTYRMNTIQDIDPQPGEVLVGQDGQGFIRKVVSASKDGDEWVIETSQGTLEDVIEEISLSDSLVIDVNGGSMKTARVNGQEVPVNITYTAPGLKLKTGPNGIALGPLVLIDEDVEGGHVYAALQAGNVVFNPVFRRRIDIRMRNGLEHFIFAASGEMDITAGIDIESSGAASLVIDPVTLFSADIGPVMIGPVPTTINIRFAVQCEVGSGGAATYSIGYESRFQSDYGAEYYHLNNPKWTSIWEKYNESTVSPPSFDLESTANVNITINPALSMKVAGVQTAYLSLNNYLKSNANSGTEGWTVNAYAGTNSSLDYDVDVLGYDVEPGQFENPVEEWLIYEAGGSGETPIVSTLAGEIISEDSYLLKGRVEDDRGSQISRVGFCWGAEPTPDFEDNYVDLLSGENFEHLLESLDEDQTFYYRAFAENADGVGWGVDQEFRTGIELPTVQTTPAYNIMALSAWAGGVVLDDGGAEVTERGIWWDADGNPDMSDTVILAGSGTGSFECELEALYCANTYYVRAFATNSAGTAYGEILHFGCKDNDGIFTDPRDGNRYYWITYGEEDMMINNLAYLPEVSPLSEGSMDSPHYYVYDYNGDQVAEAKQSDNWDNYHTLYNWTAAMDACPEGWHLADWGKVNGYLENSKVYSFTYYSTSTGKSLASKIGWTTSTNEGTPGFNLGNNNTSGFDARPGGYRHPTIGYSTVRFVGIGRGAYFWSSYHDGDNASSYYQFYKNQSPSSTTFNKAHALSVRCARGIVEPYLETKEVSEIEESAAICGGNVIGTGGSPIISRGVCWTADSGLPTIDDSITDDGPGKGDFSSALTGLTPETTYTVRAYATNSAGTSYGKHYYFTTESGGGEADGSFTDSRDGTSYDYKHYGNQTWMINNLEYLPEVSPSNESSLEDANYYVYGYEGSDAGAAKQNSNFDEYGVLYNLASAKIACPSGWYLPTHEDWTELENFLEANGFGFDGSGDDIGKSMASASGWNTDGSAGNVGNDQTSNNTSSFNAPPGGYKSGGGGFGAEGSNATYWTSSPYESTRMWTRYLYYNHDVLYNNDYDGKNGFSIRCIQGTKPDTKAVIFTEEVGEISQTTAISGGKVLDDGGATVTARGVCWNTSGNPTTSDDKTNDGSGIGSFTSNITGLTDGTTYFIRAYAINSVGIAYGMQFEFTTEEGGGGDGTFTDSRDGTEYEYKYYGNQTWMIENLAYLPSVAPSSQGAFGSSYFYVNGYEGNDVSSAKLSDNYSNFGVLYNHQAAKVACPSGWHVPTHEEWTELENSLISDGFGFGGSGDDIGKSMASTSGWANDGSPGNVGNDQSTNNTSNFNAGPGGYRSGSGGLGGNTYNATFWSSSPYQSTRMWTRFLNYNGGNFNQNDYGSQNGFSIRCIQGSKPNTIPMVFIEEITGITENSVQIGAKVTEDGGASITAKGICWNTTGNPDISDNKTTDGSGVGSFTSNITGLSESTTYYVRAYATNSVGTSYGFEKQFTTEAGGDGEVGTFSDSRDGKVYSYKQYGSQTWMTENLAYLPEVYSSAGGSDASRYYYVYGYEGEDVGAAKAEANYSTYGALYNWDAATYECPAGWHLPSISEWGTLLNYLRDNGYGYQGSGDDVAKSMASTSGWDSSENPGEVGNNQGENNSSGFNALPSGYRYSEGGFNYLGNRTFFWSSDTNGTSSDMLAIRYLHTTPGQSAAKRSYGFPVRCLKD